MSSHRSVEEASRAFDFVFARLISLSIVLEGRQVLLLND